jgi:hypothetical protein
MSVARDTSATAAVHSNQIAGCDPRCFRAETPKVPGSRKSGPTRGHVSNNTRLQSLAPRISVACDISTTAVAHSKQTAVCYPRCARAKTPKDPGSRTCGPMRGNVSNNTRLQSLSPRISVARDISTTAVAHSKQTAGCNPRCAPAETPKVPGSPEYASARDKFSNNVCSSRTTHSNHCLTCLNALLKVIYMRSSRPTTDHKSAAQNSKDTSSPSEGIFREKRETRQHTFGGSKVAQ